MSDYVLYVAPDHNRIGKFDLGSVLCMQIVELMPPGTVEVLNCDVIKREDMPSWLIGTPTLVAESGSDIYRGQYAVMHLQRASVTLASRKAAPAVQTNTKTQPRPAANPPPDVQAASQQPADDYEDENTEIASLWTSAAGDDNDDDNDGGSLSRKITMDDLAQAVSARRSTQQQSALTGPPRPPPVAEKD